MAKGCPYGKCGLPKNNSRFAWQFFYILFGIICLASNESEFSFFPLFTFVAPVLIDLFGGEIDDCKVAQFFRILFIVVDVVIVLVCLCGWCGIFTDAGSAFVISSKSMVLAGKQISKKYVLVAIIANVGVPLMYGVVSPSQANRNAAVVGAISRRRGEQ